MFIRYYEPSHVHPGFPGIPRQLAVIDIKSIKFWKSFIEKGCLLFRRLGDGPIANAWLQRRTPGAKGLGPWL